MNIKHILIGDKRVKLTKFLLILISIFLLIPNGVNAVWESDTEIASGLGASDDRQAITVYDRGGTTYGIITELTDIIGYNWSGSTWQGDGTANSGIGLSGSDTPRLSVFEMGSQFHCIQGKGNGAFDGYTWSGSAWTVNASVYNPLGDIGFGIAPEVFYMDGIWYMIIGNIEGLSTAYNWTGSVWQSDTGIISGLVDHGSYNNIAVYQKDSVWYIAEIAGTDTVYGYNWTGSTWQGDSTSVSGLIDHAANYRNSIDVFQIGTTWYCLIGNASSSGYDGFKLPAAEQTFNPPTPTDLQNTSGEFWVNYTWSPGSGNVTDSYNILMNSTWHNSTVESYFNQSLSNCAWGNITVYAYNSTGTGELSASYVSDQVQMSCTAPAQVTGLQNDTYQTTMINISWTPNTEDDLWGYQVFRNDSYIAYTQNSYYNDTGLTENTLYNYIVRANNTFNMRGANSTILNVYTSKTPTTNPPINLNRIHGNYWVNWTWDEGTGDYNVDTYNVSINNIWYNTSGDIFYNHTGLSMGSTSSIIVYSYNSTFEISLDSVSGSYTFTALSTQIYNNYYGNSLFWCMLAVSFMLIIIKSKEMI